MGHEFLTENMINSNSIFITFKRIALKRIKILNSH